jgi:hypothetical protein
MPSQEAPFIPWRGRLFAIRHDAGLFDRRNPITELADARLNGCPGRGGIARTHCQALADS